MRHGVVAAGHPATAEAGAEILLRGGNAVDAAVAAALTSFVAESPLTGFGAGGFMLVHDPGRRGEAGGGNVLIDFFVAAPGRDGIERRSELVPIPVYFDRAQEPQTFNVGAASCGVPGTAAGLWRALERFGSMPLAELAEPGIRIGRDGVEMNRMQAFLFEILEPILTHTDEAALIYAPEGRMLCAGETFRAPEIADAIERFAAEGPDGFYRGDVAQAISNWVVDRGGTLGLDDLAAYEPIERAPVRAAFRGTDVLTNPPPSSGGILIAFSLAVLERLGDRSDVEALVAAIGAANASRGEEFQRGLYEPGYLTRFMARERIDAAVAAIRAGEIAPRPPRPGDALGSTTHLAVLDGNGMCASVTCSNGTGSGLLVPGTGVHVNNMLGEEDLNPLGFHRTPAGERLTSMMAPTVVLHDDEIVLGLGSAGSNRIRSAILDTIVRSVEQGMSAGDAVASGRLHFEDGVVQAEPGVEEAGLRALERRGVEVVRWSDRNLFFGGVQAVARDRDSGELSGGGDPRRGGAVVVL